MAVHESWEGVEDRLTVQREAELLLRELGRPEGDLSIVLCNDDFIRELNVQWRDKHEPTDVLSFPQEGPAPVDLLGDVVISVETAARQAREHGHDLESELRILLVHGVCHLLGHDHHDDEEARRMQAEEARLLAVLGGGAGLVERANGHQEGDAASRSG